MYSTSIAQWPTPPKFITTTAIGVFGNLRRFPRSARNVYERGPASFTNLSVYAFGLSALWISVNTALLQFRVLDISDEDQKNGMLGAIALVGLVAAALSQPLMGATSDHTNSRWGKRVPYIVAGNLGLIAVVPFLGIADSFLSILIVIALIQFFLHMSQGPANALLIDHVPARKRGSGAGALNLSRVFGGGFITVVVMLLMSRSTTGDGPSSWYWASIGRVMIIFALTTLWRAGSLRPRPGSARVREADELAPEFPSSRVTVNGPEETPNMPHDMKGYYWFLVAMAMIVGALTAMQIFAVFFIRDKVGLDNLAASAVALTLTIALGAAMFLSGGWALITELVPGKDAGRALGLTAFSTRAGTGVARLSGFGIDALNRRSENLGYNALILGIVALLILSTYPLQRARMGLSRTRSDGRPVGSP